MKQAEDPSISAEIYSLLYGLGARANSTSFFHTAYAVHLAAAQPQKLLLVTKWLYPEVARHYHSTWGAVERSIRRVVTVVWESHPERLERLAGQILVTRPTPTQFLMILTQHLRRNTAA